MLGLPDEAWPVKGIDPAYIYRHAEDLVVHRFDQLLQFFQRMGVPHG